MSGTGADLVVHDIAGDDTGRVVVNVDQTFNTTQSRALVQFSVVAQRESSVRLPPTIDCRNIHFVIKGEYFVLVRKYTYPDYSLIWTHDYINRP